MSIIKPPSLPPLCSKKNPRAKNPSEKFLVDLDQFKIVQNKIKKGSIGLVNIVSYKKNNEILASKTSYFQVNEQHKPFISRDIRTLISIQHPTLIPYRGFSYNDFNGQNNITILMNYIKSIPLSEMIDNNILSSSSFDNTKRQIILVGIARGMMILHKHHILHQDLKAENVLLDKHYQPVITDFGLTKIFNPINSPIQNKNPYLAPEVISGSKYNSKSDVYSFGIIMYEILTGQRFYKNQNFEQKIAINDESEEGFFPEFPSNSKIKKGIKTIVEKCLSKSPTNRPTFSEIFKKLSLLQIESDEKDVIIGNENDSNFENLEFCLEKVDLEKLFAYVERIIDETPFDKAKNERKLINEEMQVLKMHNKEMSRKIRALEKENEQLKNEIFHLKNENTNDNDLQTIKRVSNRRKQLEDAIKIANETVKDENDNNNKIKLQKNEKKDQLNEIETQEKSEIQPIEEQKSLQEPNNLKELLDNAHDEVKNNEEAQSNQIKQNEEIESKENIQYNKKIDNNESDKNSQNNQIDQEEQQIFFNEPKKIFENASFFQSTDDLDEFNNLNGEDQLLKIQQMQSNINKQTYDKIIGLLTYLSSEIQDLKQKSIIFILPNIVIENEEIKDSNTIIGINSATTEDLFNNGSLNSTELSGHIDNFDEFYIEISYPSPHFKDIYANVLKMRKSHQTNLKISIFITSSSTDQFFHGNCEINCVKFDKNVQKIESLGFNGSFEGCISLSRVIISTSIKTIGAYSFKGCLSLLSVNIPSSVISIDDWSFSDCISLLFVEISPSVIHVGSNCFNGCKSLCKIEFSASLSSIKYGMFYDCCSLFSFEIPPSVKVIESNAFEGCLNLRRIEIPSSVTVIEYSAFSGCCSLTNVSIPDSVESIGCSVFNECSRLENIVIPKKVESIQHHCFADCKSLKNVEIQSSIKYIGYNAFDGCSSLHEIEVPQSTKAIGYNAFANCSSLVQITIPSSINWYPIGIGPDVEIKRIENLSC